MLKNTMRLIYGAGGIYGAYLYYGSLLEDVFNHVGSNTKSTFTYIWFLQVFEATTNVIVGFIGWSITSRNMNLPQKNFVISSVSHVASKTFMTLALSHGLSFSVVTMAKSAKIAPVMIGSVVLGGAVYSLREYIQIGMIVLGTAILSMDKSEGGESQSTPMGLVFIVLSLIMDGITGGVQKYILEDVSASGSKLKSYDLMLFTNFYMMIIAIVMSIITRDFISGISYCASNPEIVPMLVHFSLCSALGQSFIYYTIAHFDPFVCTTVTTTRKIFSVLISIFLKGHYVTGISWVGVVMAVSGIVSELDSKVRKSFKKKDVGI